MRFDVLGRAIHARVSGIRRVEWREGRSGGFMFVFGAGTFEGAPHWYFAPVRANLADPAQRGKFTHDLVVRFPNVSVIDLREILESVRKVFQVVTVAIDVVGSLVILTGGLILDRRRRGHEVSAGLRSRHFQDAGRQLARRLRRC